MSTTDITETATALVDRLGQAWNDGDGAAFGAEFAVDADFVDVRGDHHRGRAAIAAGHQVIFDSVYSGSTVDYRVESVRSVAPGVAAVVVGATMVAPTGPLAGTNEARFTAVLAEQDGDWRVATFHNTPRAAVPAHA